MFGLLNPGKQDLLYRRAYARCCQHQRKRYGLPSLTFLSYESVLLYLVAADAMIVPLTELPTTICCKLRRLPAGTPQAERDVARFCSSFGMLLASIKVSDDLRDGPSFLTRLANWILRRRFSEAFDYFRRLDPAFEQRVNAFVHEHLSLEKRSEPVPLSEYVEPTARAFGYVFSLFGRAGGVSLLLPQQGAHAPRSPEDFLEALGEHVGSAIVAFDCAMDRDRDRLRGAYNPLPDGDNAVADALTLTRRHLYLAAEACRQRFGEESHTRRVLLTVACRIPRTCQAGTCQRFKAETRSLLQRWGLTRRKGVQLNEGLDAWIGVAGFVAICVGALICLFSSGKKAEGGDAAEKARTADVPPVDPNAPLDPAAQAAAAAAAQPKKRNTCCGDACFCDCCDCCEGCPSDCGGCENIDCGGCDACSGCDCNCG